MDINELKALGQRIVEDGVVDPAEVEELHAVMGDGIVDREVADVIFDINDAVTGHDNCSEWKDFVVEAISSHVLNDEDTPGEVDASEEEWLMSRIEDDGEVDEVGLAILQNIGDKAVRLPATMIEKIESLID
ncbi:MAG: TerB family tellurite resistance protein [bacterium]|nr:TerB family tellurite resistance protein [bacterium]